MVSRLIYAALLAFVSACDHAPVSDPTKPGEKHVITAAELLGDTSNLSSRVKHSTAVDLAWNKKAHVEWTIARQGTEYVISDIVVRFPSRSAHEAYTAKLLNVQEWGSKFSKTRMVVSLHVKRTGRWGEKGAMVTLHADGVAVVGMYRRWPWSDVL
jgi:hypothetical protein